MGNISKNKYRYVGKSVVRVDAWAKVTGKADFLKDMKFARLLHAKMVLSPQPHARLSNVNTAKAKRCGGVVSVAAAVDVPHKNQIGLIIKDQPLFAFEKVRYAGDAIAIIAAESEEEAEYAATKVTFDLE
ncbi:MAG: hypothetical protein IH789_09290, partial [Acidobacteria bacterium]|nr:hypothetical protein [Acidobacteriota bacterium]